MKTHRHLDTHEHTHMDTHIHSNFSGWLLNSTNYKEIKTRYSFISVSIKQKSN